MSKSQKKVTFDFTNYRMVKLLRTTRVTQLVLVVALVACVSFGIGYGLKYGFYTKVTRSIITDVTSSDSLRLEQEEEEVTRPEEMVTVKLPQDTGTGERENYTQVSETQSVPMSHIIFSKHYVPLTNAILKDLNVSYSESVGPSVTELGHPMVHI